MAQQIGFPGDTDLLQMIQGLEVEARELSNSRRQCFCGGAAGGSSNDTDEDLAHALGILEDRARGLASGQRPCACDYRDDEDSDAEDADYTHDLKDDGNLGPGPLPKQSPGDDGTKGYNPEDSLEDYTSDSEEIPGDIAGDIPGAIQGDELPKGDQADSPPDDGSQNAKQPPTYLPSEPSYMEDLPDEDYYILSSDSEDDGGKSNADPLSREADFNNVMDIRPIYARIKEDREKSPPSHGVLDDGRYYKFIPSWTHPAKSTGGTTPYERRRPALLAQDRLEGLEFDYPSKYAMRFGKDPDAPPDASGRSMLSPIPERLGLGDQEFPGPSVPDWQEDWQRWVFGGHTAAELVQLGAFDPDMIFKEPILDMSEEDIHPILRHDNWLQPDREGTEEDEPLLLYKLDEKIRTWDMQAQPQIWNAIKPALKLVSRVLYSRPPFWEALLDLCNLGPIDSSRIPARAMPQGETTTWDTLTAVHCPPVEDQDIYPNALALRASGFDSLTITEHVLNTYVALSFADRDIEDASGVTYSVNMRDEPAADMWYHIHVKIAPQVLWPLLVPELSAAERSVNSFLVANVLLHELAHAIPFAHSIMTTSLDWNMDPALRRRPCEIDLQQLPRQQMNLLNALGVNLHGRNPRPMYFIQGEPCAEEGYSFEKHLWGGTLDQIVDFRSGFEIRYGFPEITASLREWPHSVSRPRPYYRTMKALENEDEYNGWPIWLTYPPANLVRRETALPVKMVTRYLDEDFWSGVFSKYGHESLKLSRHQWEGKPLRTGVHYEITSKRYVQKAFRSKRAYFWMRLASDVLYRARKYALGEYMLALSRSVVESDMMRQRLHYEKKTWPVTDAKLRKLDRKMTRTREDIKKRLAEYTERRDVVPIGTAEIGGLLYNYLETVWTLFVDCQSLNRSLGEEIPYLQKLVLSYLRQEDHVRPRLQNYYDLMLKRIDRVLGPVADNMIDGAGENMTDWEDMLDEYEQTCAAQSILMGQNSTIWRGLLETLRSHVRATLPATRQHITDLREVIASMGQAVTGSGPGGGPLALALARDLDLVVDTSGVRPLRAQRREFRNLALRDLRRISGDSSLRPMVEEWFRVLATHDKLRGAATAEERQALLRAEPPAEFPETPPAIGGLMDNDDVQF